MPQGWNLSFDTQKVERVAQVVIDYKKRNAQISFDTKIFNDKNIPEGIKIFLLFHEIGHLIYGPAEELCDEFSFWCSLRLGVTPYTCFLALLMYMPKHYQYRVDRLQKIILSNPQLKNSQDAN